MPSMKEDNSVDRPEVGPDMFVPPHVLPSLMELFAGESQRVLSQQEQLLAHIATCHYCRTAIMVLLSYELEYDRRSEYPEDPTRDLLMLFANITHKIEVREARESECMGVHLLRQS